MQRQESTIVLPTSMLRIAQTARAARLRRTLVMVLVTVLVFAGGVSVAGCTSQESPDSQSPQVEEQSGQAAAGDAAQNGAESALADVEGAGTNDSGSGVGADDEAAADDESEESDADGGDAAAADADDDSGDGDEALVELDITPRPVIDNIVFVEGDEVVELPESTHVLIGQPAPDFTMTLLETGEDVSLSDYAGRPVLVDFWATWCPPCRLEMPFFEGVYQDHQDEGLVIIAVDAGERVPPSMMEDTVRRFVDGKGLTFPVVYGENAYEVQSDWSVVGLPASFLIGRDGIVVDAHQGAYPNQATLEDQLQQIPGGEAEG